MDETPVERRLTRSLLGTTGTTPRHTLSRYCAALGDGLAEPVPVIALVGNHRLGPGESIEHQPRALVVALLALRRAA